MSPRMSAVGATPRRGWRFGKGGPLGRPTFVALVAVTSLAVTSLVVGCGEVSLLAPATPLPEGWSLQDDRPYPRVDARVVLDESADRLVLFGPAASDTWELPLRVSGPATWRPLVAAGPLPPPHGWGNAVIPGAGAAVYDPYGRRMIVLVGDAQEQSAPRLWALSLTERPSWAPLTVAGAPPGASATAERLTLDRRERRLLLSRGGGADAGIWAISLDGVPRWSPITKGLPWPSATIEGPPPVMDERRHDLLFVAPESGSTPLWRFSLEEHRWSLLDAGSDVSSGWGLAVAPDRARDRLVILGGGPGGGLSFLSLRDHRWSSPALAGVGARRRSFAVPDPARDRILFVAGTVDGRVGNGLAAFDGATSTWSTLTTSARWMDPLLDNHQGAAVWDPFRQHVVAFGYDRDGYRTLVHGLAPSDDWRLLAARSDGLLASLAGSIYDPRREAIVSFAGVGVEPTKAVVSLSSRSPGVWERWSLPDGPRERYAPLAVYDTVGQRMLVFGGRSRQGAGASFNDTWALSLGEGAPRWLLLAAAGNPPSPRAFSVGAFDRENDRLVVFGGRDEDDLRLADLHVLALEGTPTWSTPAVRGVPPSDLTMPSAVYDHHGQRLVIVDLAETGARTYALTLRRDEPLTWHRFCDVGAVPAGDETSTNVVSTGDGLFATVNGGAFRFSFTTPYCDEGPPGYVVPAK